MMDEVDENAKNFVSLAILTTNKNVAQREKKELKGTD